MRTDTYCNNDDTAKGFAMWRSYDIAAVKAEILLGLSVCKLTGESITLHLKLGELEISVNSNKAVRPLMLSFRNSKWAPLLVEKLCHIGICRAAFFVIGK